MKVAALAIALLATSCAGGSSTPVARHTATPSASATPTRTGPHSQVVLKARVGGSPCGVASTAGAVWVSDADGAQLIRLNPTTGKVVARTALDSTPCAITVAYGSLWIVTQSGVLDRVDPATGHTTAAIQVGLSSYQAVATPGAIWVSNRNSGTLSHVDPRTNRVTETLPIQGIQPGGMVYAAGALWVGDDTDTGREVVRVDLRTHALTKFAAGQRPGYLAAAAGSVFVSDVAGGTVTVLDARTGLVRKTVPAGTSPVNLAVRPGPNPEVWVPDDTGGNVVRIDAQTGDVIENIEVPGDGPALIAAVGGDIWVTMFPVGEVWRLHPAAR